MLGGGFCANEIVRRIGSQAGDCLDQAAYVTVINMDTDEVWLIAQQQVFVAVMEAVHDAPDMPAELGIG